MEEKLTYKSAMEEIESLVKLLKKISWMWMN